MTMRPWRRLAAAGALATLLATPCSAKAPPPACPPTAQPPTAAQLQAAQQQARDRGFLWRISRGGHSSYLFGTVHLGKLEWLFPGPTVRQALMQTDILALELDVGDAATMQEIAAAARANPDAPPLPADLAARLSRQVQAACLPAGALDDQQPLMRAITLSMLVSRWDGLDPGYGQEIMLAGAARARGVPVVALETAALQLDSLIPRDPVQAQDLLGQTLRQIETGVARRGAVRLARAWADGRLDDVADYERWCECVATDDDRATLRRLNDDRNPGMAERIATLHGSGSRVFAAVGALHMTGPNALPALLAQRGFSVERVSFPR